MASGPSIEGQTEPSEFLPPVPPHEFIPSYLTKVEHVHRSQFHTKDEMALRDISTDAWVAVGGNVLNVSDLTDIPTEEKTLAEVRARANLAKHAGQNLTHWFKPRCYPLQLRQCSNFCHDGQTEYFLPQGIIPDVLPFEPVTNYAMPKAGHRSTEWWNDSTREVGKLTKKMRKIYVVNMLFADEPENATPDLLHVRLQYEEVCAEETLDQILFRYLDSNRHAGSYTWKFEGEVLTMEKTLEENGLADDESELKELDINVDVYIPTLHVYFNDDLTEA
ncbi:hypothetical protein RvY_08460 [Ramazzottius varieornatus]|uniref:Cytochrome b5 heme-binding domain-containing protein n=1 Tax=Ramazzottius varieornatus TaxID=947166 RepID=A0A1D1VBI3_RAMVA|nr:hypothetical protein RvY_08460 [Ramazzottius varieornatus]